MADNRTYTDPIIELMNKHSIPVTRENYIEQAWPEVPSPWLPEHEAELPEQLQDWAVFERQPS